MTVHLDTIHASTRSAPPGVKHNDSLRGCCVGEALFEDPTRCTCWEPIFDAAQVEPVAGDPETRTKCCHDCAYRTNSPERERGDGDHLEAVAAEERAVFFCHQGMRRVLFYRHPDGTILPADPGDYRPPIIDGVAYRSDGTPGERCGGWAALRGQG